MKVPPMDCSGSSTECRGISPRPFSMTADAGDVGGVTLEGTSQKNGCPTAAAAPTEIAQSVEESMKRTEEAEIKLEASATLEDRITLLASLVGQREAAAAAVMTRARAGSNVAPAAPVRLCHLLQELEEILLLSKWDEVESSSLIQLRKLCLHLLTSPTGDRATRRSYAVDTLAAAVLKATFRRAPDGGGDALELEAACASLLDAAAESLPKEVESAVAILRRMSALKAAVDLTTVGLPMTRAIQRDLVAAIRRHLSRFGRQSVWAHVECRKNASIQLERLLRAGFLNDQSTALDDARYCVINHLAEKEMSVEVRTLLFRCLALFPRGLSDAMHSMCINTLVKPPASVADLESSVACADVLYPRVTNLNSLRKKLKSKGVNNAAVMITMARCGVEEDGPMRPLKVLEALLGLPGDPAMEGVAEGGDAGVFVKCCCSLVWRASELGQGGEVFDYIVQGLRDAKASRTTFQTVLMLRLVEVCIRAGGVPGSHSDRSWPDVLELLMTYVREPAGVTAEAASSALTAVLEIVRCDPSFTNRIVGLLGKEAPVGEVGWRKLFGLCQLAGSQASSAHMTTLTTAFEIAMNWLGEGVDSCPPRAACALTLLDGCLGGSVDRCRWVAMPRLQQVVDLLDGLLGSPAVSELQQWIITTAALGNATEVDSTAELNLNDHLVLLLLGQRVLRRLLSAITGGDSDPSEDVLGIAERMVGFVKETMDLLKFLPSPLGPINDSQPKLIRSLTDRGIPDRLRVFQDGSTGSDIRPCVVGMRLLAEIKSCCCDTLRTVMESGGGLLDGPQVEDVVAGLMEDVSGRVVPVHGGSLLLGELEEPAGVPPSDWISSGAVLTVMEQGGGQGDEAKAARELLRSISDTLAVGLAVSERRAESIDTMVRSVLDSFPLVDFSSVEEGTQVVIPNDLRSVVLLRTLVKVAELLRDDSGESEAACFDKVMTLVAVALLKPLDGARLNAIMKLLVAVAPTFPERVRVLVRGIFDSSDCREEAVVNGCLAVDALTETVDVWEEFSRSRSRLAYSTNPRLHFAVLSALRHGGTRALSLSVAHLVEESWDSRAAWEQHSRVLEACKESSPTALSLTLMRCLELMAGETSETVSTSLLEYSVACVESSPEVVQRLCRQLITSEYYGPRRQAVSCLLQLTEKSIPVGAVEWGPALVRLYSNSAVRGEEGLCEEIDQLVRSMKHVQPRGSLGEALEVLGGLALSPCAAASDNTFRRPDGHRRSRFLEAMREQVMEDASSPVAAAAAAGGDSVAPPRPAVLLPRARALAVRLLGVVVDNVEVDAADGGSPEAVLRFTLTVANSSDEKAAGPSVDWNALYLASLVLLLQVLRKYSVVPVASSAHRDGAPAESPRLASYEAQVVPVIRAALQAASSNIQEVACDCAAICLCRSLVATPDALLTALVRSLNSIGVDDDGRLVFESRHDSEASASSAYFKCIITLAKCMVGYPDTLAEASRAALVVHIERLLQDCSAAVRLDSGEEATGPSFLTLHRVDFPALSETVRGPLADATVVLAWVLEVSEGDYVELSGEIVMSLLTTGWAGLSWRVLSGVLLSLVDKGMGPTEAKRGVVEWAERVGYDNMGTTQLVALSEAFDKFECSQRVGCAVGCLRRGVLIEKSITTLLAHASDDVIVDSPFPMDTVLVAPEETIAQWEPDTLPSTVVTRVARKCITRILDDPHLVEGDTERLLEVLKRCPTSTWNDNANLTDDLSRALVRALRSPLSLKASSLSGFDSRQIARVAGMLEEAGEEDLARSLLGSVDNSEIF